MADEKHVHNRTQGGSSDEGDSAASPGVVSTWDVLVDVGFREDSAAPMRSFCYDFGNFKLSALRCTNPSFVEIVLLTGVMRGRGSLAEVHGEIGVLEASRQVVLAHVAWTLDRAAGGIFRPGVPADWLEEGRTNIHLLPWIRRQLEYREFQKKYQARPHCYVDRKWMRTAVSTLRDYAQADPGEKTIAVMFDGRTLAFEAPDLRCNVAASGDAWPEAVTVRAIELREFQKRFKGAVVVVSAWNGHLEIGNVTYPLSVSSR